MASNSYSENNIDLLKQILDAPNRRSLIDSIGNVYDEICNVEEEEDDNEDAIGNDLMHHDDNDNNGPEATAEAPEAQKEDDGDLDELNTT